MTATQLDSRTIDVAPRRREPVVYWAALGAVLVAFEAYVLIRWVTGPHFTATHGGSDHISNVQLWYLRVLQVLVTGATLACLYVWVVRPWRRNGGMTTDGMLAVSCGMFFFWDMSYNYTSVSLLYNSHMVNFGAWANGSWPGWMSPNGARLPEPIFVTLPGYTCLVFSQALVVCALLRRAKRRWPGMGIAGSIGFIVVGMTVIDSLIEILLIRTGVYAYPGAIRAVSLFAGKTYQFPLTEGLFFGGLGVGAVAALTYFRDDRGRTVVERGVDRLRIGKRARSGVRFLAIFGFCHALFALLYFLPNQWLGAHSDPFPKGYPSYMINGMCVSGPAHNQCPGPGVSLPRP
jgi:hypothetical protein